MKGFENIIQELIRTAVEDVINKKVAEVQHKLERIERTLNVPSEQIEYLTTSEACKYLKISLTTLYRYRKEGKINAIKIGGKLLFKKSGLAEV